MGTQIDMENLRIQQVIKALASTNFADHQHRAHALVAPEIQKRLEPCTAIDQVQKIQQELLRLRILATDLSEKFKTMPTGSNH